LTKVATLRVMYPSVMGLGQQSPQDSPQVTDAQWRRQILTAGTQCAAPAFGRRPPFVTLWRQFWRRAEAPEQVRHHAISRQLVQVWMRRGRGRPSYQLASLAQRVRVAA
jgi:hypothetical protein